MLKNHLKIAWRNIWKSKVFSIINIIGLSIGLSAAFVIGAIVYYDLTFDDFHKDGQRIYRITTDFTSPQGDFHNRGVSVPMGEYAKKNMTGLETVSIFFNKYFSKVDNKDLGLTYRNIGDAVLASPSYFELFEYTWLAGSKEALLEPNQMILTKSRAKKYFPDLPLHQIIGKTLIYNDLFSIKISGIVADLSKRTDLFFKEFISLETARNTDMEYEVYTQKWDNTNSATQVFIKVSPGTNLDDIQEQLDIVALEYSDKEMLAYGQKRTFHLQPLADIHFNPDYGVFNNSEYQASRKVLISLAFVALFLLLLGCINFVNLNTAQATQRAKAIGIRKILGSSKKQLILHFLGETFLLTLAAATLSLFLSSYLLQAFSDFVPQSIGFDLFTTPIILFCIVILLILVTVLSGFYPALALSRFRPISVLKNQVILSNDKSTLRKCLTVFQFVIAQTFIIATLLVGKQINYMLNKDMGFETDTNVFIRMWHDSDMGKRKAFFVELGKIPEISNLSLAGTPPASTNVNSSMASFTGKEGEIHTSLEMLFADLNYLKLYNIKLLAGRDRLNDTIKEYVVNETYTKILGFKDFQDIVGQSISFGEGPSYPIVGVMADFHQRSLRSEIKPMALVGDCPSCKFPQFNTIHFSLNIQGDDVLAKIEEAWKSIYLNEDFNIHFLDETVRQFYEQERKTSILLKWATGLAILISCLGLLGLVLYTTERRTKEIGIRKVLGASLAQLNFLLCNEFLLLVGIAFFIAAPVAYLGIDMWLQGFAFKIGLSLWVFLLSGVSMLLIALTVISIRTIAVAKTNPVESLRTE